MVDSTELAFIVIDAQIDYNMKLITMFLIFAFSIFGFWYGKRMELKSWADIILVLMSKLMFYPTIFFIPLYLLLLSREFDYITMWTWLVIAYSLVFFIVFFIVLIKGAEFIFRMVGYDMSYDAWKDNRMLRKENEGLL